MTWLNPSFNEDNPFHENWGWKYEELFPYKVDPPIKQQDNIIKELQGHLQEERVRNQQLAQENQELREDNETLAAGMDAQEARSDREEVKLRKRIKVLELAVLASTETEKYLWLAVSKNLKDRQARLILRDYLTENNRQASLEALNKLWPKEAK